MVGDVEGDKESIQGLMSGASSCEFCGNLNTVLVRSVFLPRGLIHLPVP